MTTSTLKRPNRNLLWGLADVGITWVAVMAGLDFYYQYLHTPAVHMFFQSQGIFLF